MTIAASARLNTGQIRKSMKSMTRPFSPLPRTIPSVTTIPEGRRSAPGLGLLVLDAQAGIWKGLEPGFLDGPPAPLADPERPAVEASEGLVDLAEEVADVVLERKIALPLEGGGGGV